MGKEIVAPHVGQVYCTFMTAVNVGQEIKRQRESRGLSLRELEKKLHPQISRRHIARFENNDFSSSTEKLEILLRELFSAKKAREMSTKAKSFVATNKQDIQKRRSLKKAVTRASKMCISNIHIVYNTMHNFSLPARPKAKIKTELVRGDFGLHMEIKFRNRTKGEMHLVFLTQKRIQFYDYGLPNLKADRPQAYEDKEAGKKMRDFSSKFFKHPDALFAYMRKRLHEDELFTFFSRGYFGGNKGEKPILLRKTDLELVMQGLKEAYETKNHERKMALDNTVNFVKSLENRPSEILALRDDLLRVVSSIS